MHVNTNSEIGMQLVINIYSRQCAYAVIEAQLSECSAEKTHVSLCPNQSAQKKKGGVAAAASPATRQPACSVRVFSPHEKGMFK